MPAVAYVKMAGVAGFEPAGCRSQSPVPYRLATPQYKSNHFMGWIIGVEPTASRATIWRSNQLSYIHHVTMVRLKGVEPLAHGLEVRCSIQLSYRRSLWSG